MKTVQRALTPSPFLRGMSRPFLRKLKAKQSPQGMIGYVGEEEVEETFGPKGGGKFVD